MACADKTYVNAEQYLIVKEWWIKTRKKQIRELGHVIHLYPLSNIESDIQQKDMVPEFLTLNQELEYYKDKDDFTLWNTSTKEDIWLALNCKLDFIQNRLIEQYGDDWFIFKLSDKIDFEKYIRIWVINDNKSSFYSFKNEDKNIVYLDKIVVYGTTKLFETLDEIKKILYWKTNKSIVIEFEYYGLICSYKKGKIYSYDQEINIGYFNENDIKLPKLKYSFNHKDVNKYSDDQIYISTSKEFYPITDFINYNKKDIKQYLIDIPDTIKTFIK
jgi:hypothetical protein